MHACRSINVLGFTRETVNALVAGIESVEWKRREYANAGQKMEHPRSGTPQMMWNACFHNAWPNRTGKYFTLRQARYTWRKACVEFAKRLDPDLGFYYFSSSHDRFYEGERPHFDEHPTTGIKIKRLRAREQPANLMFGRATVPTPGARSTRMQFHNLPLNLPPTCTPGTAQQYVFEHSYSRT